MPILDSIKGPDGQIKKPILISLIGAGGLLAYLMLSKGGSSTTSTGQSSALTPDLTGLQTGLDALLSDQGGGGTGGGIYTGTPVDRSSAPAMPAANGPIITKRGSPPPVVTGYASAAAAAIAQGNAILNGKTASAATSAGSTEVSGSSGLAGGRGR